jgi:hypothetical protein
MSDGLTIAFGTETPANREEIFSRLRSLCGDNWKDVNSNAPSMGGVVEVVMIAITHITVMGVIESIRFAYERYKAPLELTMPDGNKIIVKGDPKVLCNEIARILSTDKDGTMMSENEKMLLLDKIKPQIADARPC